MQLQPPPPVPPPPPPLPVLGAARVGCSALLAPAGLLVMLEAAVPPGDAMPVEPGPELAVAGEPGLAVTPGDVVAGGDTVLVCANAGAAASKTPKIGSVIFIGRPPRSWAINGRYNRATRGNQEPFQSELGHRPRETACPASAKRAS